MKFVRDSAELNQKIVEVMEGVADLSSVYYDNGFDGAGSDPIVDDDITDSDLTAAQVTDFVTMLDQLAKFFNNQAVTAADYSVTANIVRYSAF